MEAVAAVIGAVLAEPLKIIVGSIWARIKKFRDRESNFKALQDQTNALIRLKDGVVSNLRVQEQTERDRLQDEVDVWVNQVNDLEEQVNAMKSTGDDANHDLSCSCSLFPKLCRLSNQLVKKLETVKQLQERGNLFLGQRSMPDQLIPVEHIPGPTIAGQKTASQNLTKLLHKLKDDKVTTIGVYGMGGVGKTTLVQNLNNKLEEEPSDSSFDIIIWVTVSRDTNPRKIQNRIFERLKLDAIKDEESDEAVTSRLHERLKNKECFLLILDDVWEDIDLQKLGIPDPKDRPRSKILITSRSVDVCRRMSTEDAILMVGVLNQEEAWDLFQRHAGEVAVRPGIRSVAEEVAKECAGLPLALITVGASMKGKSDVRLWENARTTLRMSAPDLKGINIEEKVFKPLKWSYDALPDDITRSCFLFCCLYPEDYNICISQLVRYWYCEGLFHERLNYEQSENQGIAIIQCLRDCCLLEEGRENDSVKVHDVVRDVGIWIASSSHQECRSLVRSGIQLTCITKKELSQYPYKRVSFMANRIRYLPEGFVQCPEVSTLLLQRNRALKIIPISFLQGFKSLKILDLSYSMIESLPWLDGLKQLRALILRACSCLKELPGIDGLSGLVVLDCCDACIRQFPYVGVSRLHELEYLDVGLDKTTPLEWQRIFEALVPLKHLTVFIARLDHFPHIGSDHLNSLERIKCFSLSVDRNHLNNEIRVRCDEYAYFCGSLEWPIELIELSLRKAPLWRFTECEEVAETLKKLAVHCRSCFSSVKVLIIWNTSLGLKGEDSNGASFDLLPNLEEIQLFNVGGLESISDLSNIMGLTFSRLRKIQTSSCEKLKCVFALKKNQKLEKLQVMDVDDCELLECLFHHPKHMVGLVPNLEQVKLFNLPSLKDLCINCTESWENLKLLQVRDCCLLEEGGEEVSVKVHDVVGDVGISIANSIEHECRSLVRSGMQLSCVTKEEIFPHIGSDQPKFVERIRDFSEIRVYRKNLENSIRVSFDKYVYFSGSLEWPIELIGWSLGKAPQWRFNDCEEVAETLKKLAVNGGGCFSNFGILSLV